MANKAIRQAIEGLSGEELKSLHAHLGQVLSRAGSEPADDAPLSAPTSEGEADRRQEQRFNVCIHGSARPLLSARNSVERTFPVTIIDLSRRGMRFLVDANAPLYPLAEVSFTGPTGRIRSVYVKLVRMRMIFRPSDESAATRHQCEIAAQAINEKELALAQERQHRLRAAGRALRTPEDLPVVLVGTDAESLKRYEMLLSARGHIVTPVTEPARLAASLQTAGLQCVVYVDGQFALLNRERVQEVRDTCPEAAQVAIIESASDRRDLLAAGIDECVHSVNADALLAMYIERAVKAKALATAGDLHDRCEPMRVLLSVESNLSLAQVGMSCHGERFRVLFSYDVDGMLAMLRCGDIDALVVDDQTVAAESWKLLSRIRLEFPHLAIIVAVHDLRLGPQALTAGATEYLPLPATKSALTQLVHSACKVAEFEAARRIDESRAKPA